MFNLPDFSKVTEGLKLDNFNPSNLTDISTNLNNLNLPNIDKTIDFPGISDLKDKINLDKLPDIPQLSQQNLTPNIDNLKSSLDNLSNEFSIDSLKEKLPQLPNVEDITKTSFDLEEIKKITDPEKALEVIRQSQPLIDLYKQLQLPEIPEIPKIDLPIISVELLILLLKNFFDPDELALKNATQLKSQVEEKMNNIMEELIGILLALAALIGLFPSEVENLKNTRDIFQINLEDFNIDTTKVKNINSLDQEIKNIKEELGFKEEADLLIDNEKIKESLEEKIISIKASDLSEDKKNELINSLKMNQQLLELQKINQQYVQIQENLDYEKNMIEQLEAISKKIEEANINKINEKKEELKNLIVKLNILENEINSNKSIYNEENLKIKFKQLTDLMEKIILVKNELKSLNYNETDEIEYFKAAGEISSALGIYINSYNMDKNKLIEELGKKLNNFSNEQIENILNKTINKSILITDCYGRKKIYTDNFAVKKNTQTTSNTDFIINDIRTGLTIEIKNITNDELLENIITQLKDFNTNVNISSYKNTISILTMNTNLKLEEWIITFKLKIKKLCGIKNITPYKPINNYDKSYLVIIL